MNCKKCEYVLEDGTCGAFECTGIECPNLPCEQWWYFTFGWGQKYAGKYVKIMGTSDRARSKMFEKYGSDWGFQYSEEEWNRIKNDPNRRWPMETELEVLDEAD